jgi:uncharacterized surface protein with fasciclin (FAS1) repeats
MNIAKYKYYLPLLSILLGLCMGCEDFTGQDIYKRPEWLPGKLYTTLRVQEDVDLFIECIKLTGLDSILDVSGSWTVFAPTDEAMNKYLSDNHYAGISNIPPAELERITKFHIIQDPWTLEQLQILGYNGWREKDEDNKSLYAYKFETILRNHEEKYWTQKEKRNLMITLDSANAEGYKRVFVQSRKYAPVFYDTYFDVNGLNSADYSFYFDREYERGNVYYAGAKILHSNIIAENGFIHIIDRVVEPMSNAKEMLERDLPGESYKLFLEMVYWYYPEFEPNMIATYNQPSVRRGGLVDTLWELNYSDLAFALHEELIGYKGSGINETLIRHNGLFAPTDEPFRQFINGILTSRSGFPHWPDHKKLPRDVQNIIITQHFKSSPLYPSTNDYRNIFSKSNRFQQNEEDIIRKEFGSNCTFIGLNSYKPDKVFTSVTGPVFLRPKYSIFRLAMVYSGAHDVIAKHKGPLYFFPIPDGALEADSSMIINWINQENYNFRAYDRLMLQMVSLNRNTIRRMILNHAGTSVSKSNNKEYIRTLGGNTITWDHSNNTIRGTRPSTIGYNGDVVAVSTPIQLDEPADNGKTWSINYWLNF